jgi:inner membrane protein
VAIGLSSPFLFFTKTISVFTILFVLFGSLFPDIDHPKSFITGKLRHVFLSLLIVLSLLLIFEYTIFNLAFFRHLLPAIPLFRIFIFLGFLYVASLFFTKFIKHRGPIHSIYAGIILSAIVRLLGANYIYTLCFLFGWIMHLYGDCWTGNGISLFWPVTGRKYLFTRVSYQKQQIYVMLNVVVSLSITLLVSYLVIKESNHGY